MKTNNIYIVNHTHWDREWYRSYNDYAATLKRGIIHLLQLLETKQIENFYFDGQTIIIEDLETILPRRYFNQFIKYVQSGKIEVGPWYVLPDEGLVDYVGYCKNIEIGMNICKKYDIPCGKVMYLPDTFGHDASIPKLAAKYELEHAIIHRGVTSTQIDVSWEMESDSLKSLVLPTREGYYQTMFHHENYLEKLDEYIAAYLAQTTSDDVLILNGCDHTFPSDLFQVRLNQFIVKNPQYVVKQVTLSEFFKQSNYNYDQTISGELRAEGKAFLLPGVLSTRQYLKVQNRELIDLMVAKYEPLAKLLNQIDLEIINIDRLWKLIIQNHPHDSICGCSIDEVHREMEVRSQAVYDSATASIRELLNSTYYYDMTRDALNNQIVIYNHTLSNSYTTNLKLYLPHNIDTTGKNIRFKSGEEWIEGEILKVDTIEKLVHDYKHEPDYQYLKAIEVAVTLDIAPGTLKVFELSLIDKVSTSEYSFDYMQWIDNNINYLWITDRGDSYNFDPVGEYQNLENTVVSVQANSHYQQVTIESAADIEQAYDFTKGQRCGAVMRLKLVTTIKFYPQNYAQVEITTDNIHQNIKIVNAIKNEENKEVTSDTAYFDIARTMNHAISYIAPENNTEVDYNQKPSQTKFTIGKDLKIYHIGQNELEILNSNVLTTLFRATGDLSRRDLQSRKGGAGPSLATPECQCNRVLKMKYLYNYGSSKLDQTNLYDLEAHQFRENNE